MSLKKKTKKVILKAIKPFIPFLLIFIGIFFAICTLIDAIFIQTVQNDTSNMPEEQKIIKTKCIEKAEYLNTCHNYINEEITYSLLDVEEKETSKLIQWSHLYSLMAFYNMIEGAEMNEELLNKIANDFESTFIYEESIITESTKTIDDEGNEDITTEERTVYILVESISIMGNYKYNYEEKSFESGNTTITKKVLVNIELIGEPYKMLKDYLRNKLHIRENDIKQDTEIVIQASNGYYAGTENIGWLENDVSSEVIINVKEIIPKDIFIWPIPNYTNITSHFGMRVHPVTGVYKLHTGTDVSAPVGTDFLAMSDGVVIKAVYDTAYGNMVMIEHENGIKTLYAHGSQILVKTNDTVKKGQAVLKVGSTGYSTGPHAHFEIRIGDKFVNPEEYFEGSEEE